MSEDEGKPAGERESPAAAHPDLHGSATAITGEPLSLSKIITGVKEEMGVLEFFRAKYVETDKNKAADMDRKLRALYWNLQILLALLYWTGGERLPREINFILAECLKFPAPSVDLMELLKRMPRPELALS